MPVTVLHIINFLSGFNKSKQFDVGEINQARLLL